MTMAAMATVKRKVAPVVLGCGAPAVLEAPEHDLDAAEAPIATIVVSDRFVA
jgi:hypothetical protein